MAASIEWQHGQRLKMEHEADSIQRRITQQYELLGKDLIRADALDEKINKRLNDLTAMTQELGLLTEGD